MLPSRILIEVLLLLQVLETNRAEESHGHVHRMYFMGPNTFSEPWHLPHTPPEEITETVYVYWLPYQIYIVWTFWSPPPPHFVDFSFDSNTLLNLAVILKLLDMMF
jgi:hypothetical protein